MDLSKQQQKNPFQVKKKFPHLKFYFVYIAFHASIHSVDHFTDLIKAYVPGTSSINKTIKLDHTKCIALICKVIAPDIFKTIVQDLKLTSFSLLIDELTDVACVKHLGVCVRYYNLRLKKICTQFLGSIPVSSATAEALYEAIKSFFKASGINYKQCFALGTDDAANLCGHRHSLYTLLKQDIPDLLLIKCVCHSLHLVCCNANEKMPSCLAYMLRETFKWFIDQHLENKSTLACVRLFMVEKSLCNLFLCQELGDWSLVIVFPKSFSNRRPLEHIFKKQQMYVTNMWLDKYMLCFATLVMIYISLY